MKKNSILIAAAALVMAAVPAAAVEFDFNGTAGSPAAAGGALAGLPGELADLPQVPEPVLYPVQMPPSGFGAQGGEIMPCFPFVNENGGVDFEGGCGQAPFYPEWGCVEVEVFPGIFMPVCPVNQPAKPWELNAAAGALKAELVKHSAGNNVLPGMLRTAAADKGLRVLFNGGEFRLARLQGGKWVSDEALALQTGRPPRPASKQTRIETANVDNTVAGAIVGGSMGGPAGLAAGAAVGFILDLVNYLQSN